MAKQKPADRERTRSKPLTLAALEEHGAFARFALPKDDFDPEGTWTHAYRLWLVSSGRPIAPAADAFYRGFLEVRRSPSAEGVSLGVRRSVLQHAGGLHDTAAQIQCAADALATPQSWNLTHTVLRSASRPVPDARVQQTGKVSPGKIQIDYGKSTSTLEVSGPLSSNWSLTEAVGRLPRRAAGPLEFTMLQDLDQVKPAQQITFQGAARHVLNGQTVRLLRFQHVGEGILPYSYYTDEAGRLLVAVGGLRAYILDPQVRQLHKECLTWIAERAKR